MTTAPAPIAPGRRSWATLLILGLLYIVSFVDRFVLALFADALRTDLGVSDAQLGLLFGTVFALAYAVFGIPCARIADRYSRKRLIIAGVVLWSSCTMLSAFANGFAMLAALRVGLAIGEAALVPAAFRS